MLPHTVHSQHLRHLLQLSLPLRAWSCMGSANLALPPPQSSLSQCLSHTYIISA